MKRDNKKAGWVLGIIAVLVLIVVAFGARTATNPESTTIATPLADPPHDSQQTWYSKAVGFNSDSTDTVYGRDSCWYVYHIGRAGCGTEWNDSIRAGLWWCTEGCSDRGLFYGKIHPQFSPNCDGNGSGIGYKVENGQTTEGTWNAIFYSFPDAVDTCLDYDSCHGLWFSLYGGEDYHGYWDASINNIW